MNDINLWTSLLENYHISASGDFIENSTRKKLDPDAANELFSKQIAEFQKSCVTSKRVGLDQGSDYIVLLHSSYLLRNVSPKIENVWSNFVKLIENQLAKKSEKNRVDQSMLEFFGVPKSETLEMWKSKKEHKPVSPSNVSSTCTTPNENNHLDHDTSTDLHLFCLALHPDFAKKNETDVHKSIELFIQLKEGYQRAYVIHLLNYLNQGNVKISWNEFLNTLEYFMEGEESFPTRTKDFLDAIATDPQELLVYLASLKHMPDIFYTGIKTEKERTQLKKALREIALKDRIIARQSASLISKYEDVSDRITIIQAIKKILEKAVDAQKIIELVNQINSEISQQLIDEYNLVKKSLPPKDLPQLPAWLSMRDSAKRTAAIIAYLSTIEKDLVSLGSTRNQLTFLKVLFMLPTPKDTTLRSSIRSLFTLPDEDLNAHLILAQIKKIPPDQRIDKIVFVAKLKHLQQAINKERILNIIEKTSTQTLIHAADGASHLIDANTSPDEQIETIQKLVEIPLDVLKKLHAQSLNLIIQHKPTKENKQLWLSAIGRTSATNSTAAGSSVSMPPIVDLMQQHTSPKLSPTEEILKVLDTLFKTELQLNVKAELTKKPYTVRMSAIDTEKLKQFRHFFQMPQYKGGISFNVENNKGNTFTVMISSKEMGPLHSLMTNGKFHLHLQPTKKTPSKQKEIEVHNYTPLQRTLNIDHEEWTKRLKKLSFGAEVIYENNTFILDFTKCYKEDGTYELNISPPKAQKNHTYPQTINAAELETTLISRLKNIPDLKKIEGDKQEHKFVFGVSNTLPDAQMFKKTFTEIVTQFSLPPPSKPFQHANERIDEEVANVHPPQPPTPPTAPKPKTSKDLLIEVIHEITEDQNQNYGWLSTKHKNEENILSWDTKAQIAISLNGTFVQVHPFFQWLCNEIKGLTFIPTSSKFLPSSHAGMRILPDFFDYPLSAEQKNELKQKFTSWMKTSEQNPPPLPEDNVPFLLGKESLAEPTIQSLSTPAMLDEKTWENCRARLNPQDPIIPHANTLFTLHQSSVNMNDLKELRTWQVHFVRFIHFLREKYREKSSSEVQFLTNLRTVLRHHAFGVDWAANAETLRNIVQHGFHFLNVGFDTNYWRSFKSIVEAFNHRHLLPVELVQKGTAPKEEKTPLAQTISRETLTLQDFLKQDQSKTAVIMTIATIGKLILLQPDKSLRNSEFISACINVRAELGHPLPVAMSYDEWENAQYERISKLCLSSTSKVFSQDN